MVLYTAVQRLWRIRRKYCIGTPGEVWKRNTPGYIKTLLGYGRNFERLTRLHAYRIDVPCHRRVLKTRIRMHTRARSWDRSIGHACIGVPATSARIPLFSKLLAHFSLPRVRKSVRAPSPRVFEKRQEEYVAVVFGLPCGLSVATDGI